MENMVLLNLLALLMHLQLNVACSIMTLFNSFRDNTNNTNSDNTCCDNIINRHYHR